MLTARVIPSLLMRNGSLVKTVQFKKSNYVGDPINVIRIFNEMEVDELLFLDIGATVNGQKPDFQLISEIASECFMPVAYGGGICDFEQIRTILGLGIEKIVLNFSAVENPTLIPKAAEYFGSQSIVAAIDVKKVLFGHEVYLCSGTKATGLDPVQHAINLEKRGVGEIIVNSIDRDGTFKGYDLDLIKKITSAVSVPVIASGGAGQVEDIGAAIKIGGASAAAIGSLAVYYGKHHAVLINFPDRNILDRVLL